MTEENLKFIIQRIDNNIANTNTKSTILLGINMFIIGGLIDNYKLIKKIAQITDFLHFIAVLSLLGLIVSVFFSVKAIIPKFKSTNSNDISSSGIFFGSISKLSTVEYKESIQNTNYNFTTDLIDQIVEVSKISNEKHKDLVISIYALVAGFGLPWIVICIALLSGGTI